MPAGAQSQTEPDAFTADRCLDARAAITAAVLPAVTLVHICPGAGWFHREHGKASK